MDENEAILKMRDLQDSIETAMHYSRARKKFPYVFLIVLAGILFTYVSVILANLYDYIITFPYLGNIPLSESTWLGVGIPPFLMWLVIAYIVYRMLKKPFTETMPGRWNNDLRDGVTGILKIIETENWQNTLMDLRLAKQAFIVLSIFQFIAYFAITFIALFFLISYAVTVPFAIELNYYVLAGVAFLIVIGLGDNSIRKSYRELWYMDNLVAELRWFYLGFQGSGI